MLREKFRVQILNDERGVRVELVNRHRALVEELNQLLSCCERFFFRWTTVRSVVHVQRVSQCLLGFWEFFSEHVADGREDFLGSVGRRDVAEEDRVPDVVVSVENETMIGSILGIEPDSQEHLADIRRDRVLISSESQEHSEKILKSVWCVLDFGVEAFAMVDRSAVPNDPDGSRVLGLVTDTEERQIPRVFVEDLLRFELSDVVLLKVVLENRPNFLESLWRQFVERVFLSPFDLNPVAAEVRFFSRLPGNGHLKLFLFRQIDDFHSFIDGLLSRSPLFWSRFAVGRSSRLDLRESDGFHLPVEFDETLKLLVLFDSFLGVFDLVSTARGEDQIAFVFRERAAKLFLDREVVRVAQKMLSNVQRVFLDLFSQRADHLSLEIL